MTTLNVQLPIVNQPNATEDPKIITTFTNLSTWANGNIDGTNVAATLTGRRLVYQSAITCLGSNPGVIEFGDTSGFGNEDGGAGGTGGQRSIAWSFLDPSNFAVTGKSNTQLILRASLSANATASAVNWTVKLYPITFSGGASLIVGTAGTAVTGSNVTFTTPGASSASVLETSPFTFPAAGAYAPGVLLSGTSAANSVVGITIQLFAVNS